MYRSRKQLIHYAIRKLGLRRLSDIRDEVLKEEAIQDGLITQREIDRRTRVDIGEWALRM